MVTRPPVPERPEGNSGVIVRELWLLIAVLLAYAPDICAQALSFTEWNAAYLLCHSLLFAAALPVVFAVVLRAVGVPPLRGFLVALFSVTMHDVLDIIQATDKSPFWPFSARPIALPVPIFPSTMYEEMLGFGGTFLLFLLARSLLRRRATVVRRDRIDFTPFMRRLSAANRILLASVVLLAAATHALRDLREKQLVSSRALVEAGRYAEGLKILDESERWPSTAKSGRADYLRGVAYLGLGERDKAETYLLRSFRADPTYLWVVIDLAMFYAESPRPLPLRKRLVSPYLEALRRDFRGQKAASDWAARIEAILARVDPSG